jgi:hypothetical protein
VTFRDKVDEAIAAAVDHGTQAGLADAIEKLHEESAEEAVRPLAQELVDADSIYASMGMTYAVYKRHVWPVVVHAHALLSADKPKCQPPATGEGPS